MEFMLLAVALFLVSSLCYYGYENSEYSHITHTISELAASGSKHSRAVSYFVFLPIGLVSGLIAFFTMENEGVFLLTGSLAIGYFFAALFPIDRHAPAVGSWKNVLHNITAGISYFIAMLGFEIIGQESDFPSIYGKVLIIIFIGSVYVPSLRAYRGILQRLAEAFIFVTLIAIV